MSNEITLLPCAFCGGESRIEEGWEGDEYCVHAYCINCPAEMIFYGTDKAHARSAISEYWNKRGDIGV